MGLGSPTDSTYLGLEKIRPTLQEADHTCMHNAELAPVAVSYQEASRQYSLPTRRLSRSKTRARTTVKTQPCLMMASVATLSCHLCCTRPSPLLAHPSRAKPFRSLASPYLLFCNGVIIGGRPSRLQSGPEPGPSLQLLLAMRRSNGQRCHHFGLYIQYCLYPPPRTPYSTSNGSNQQS